MSMPLDMAIKEPLGLRESSLNRVVRAEASTWRIEEKVVEIEILFFNRM